MTPERFRQIDKLLDLALEREPSERGRFLDEACDGDEALRTKLESLLRSHEQAHGFLAEPPSDLANEILAARERERAADERKDWPEGASKILGRYVVTEKLGGGGMGVVYAAHDPELDRKIAIKLMLPPMVSDSVSASEGRVRLLREAQAMARLSHPNVIAVHDVGTFGEQVFIAMEYVDGSTLAEWLSAKKRPWREVVSNFAQAGRGLAAAHAASIIHRDFKPDNVLVGNDGRVRVLDFGLARAAHAVEGNSAITGNGRSARAGKLDVAVSEPGKVMGTPAYMAPEQLKGQLADTRTDQFSFCAALYQGLYGELPFSGETVTALLNQMEQKRVKEAPSAVRLPARVRKVLLRGLNPAREERYESMDQLLKELTRRPPAIWRWSLALVLLAALVGLAVSSWHDRLLRARLPRIQSIAVLPFASLSAGEENAYFAQGFHDELLRQMGKIGDLRVISRTSVLQYKEGGRRNLREIADALGVSSIVEGSVQRSGNRVRVEAKLIDARSDRQMWGDRYDRDVTDVFDIQTAVAEEIAGALHARLSAVQEEQIARKPTQSTEAYDFYLRGLEYANRPGNQPDNLAIAEQLYRKAIQMDPSFALARARLAQVRLVTYWFVAGTPDRVAEEAREEAEQSLRLQPDLPEGHLALGLYHYWRHRDYDRALKELEIARSGLPAEAVSFIHAVQRRQGRFDEAIRNQQEAVHLDPRSPQMLSDLAVSLTATRQYEEADRVLDRALTIAPDFAGASALKAFVREAWKGETDLAKHVLRAARGRLERRESQGWVRLMMHNPREALPLLDSVEFESITGFDAVCPKAFLYAVAHEALGDTARARTEYETALPLLEAEVEKDLGRASQGGARQLSLLARAYAGLGRKEDALREVRRLVGLLPISKDAFLGAEVEIDRAAVEARVGETDAAIEHIRHLLSIPCFLSPGLLRIDPKWAPLRGDPRFRKLAELKRE